MPIEWCIPDQPIHIHRGPTQPRELGPESMVLRARPGPAALALDPQGRAHFLEYSTLISKVGNTGILDHLIAHLIGHLISHLMINN